MFSKYQIETKGGKALKNSDDTGLDDRQVILFYKKFKVNPANKKQVEMIEQLKTKSGITDDQEFVMQLIDEGERFLLIDERVPVDFQIELDSEDWRSYDNAIVNTRYAFNSIKKHLDANSYIYTESQNNIEDSDPDSSDETGSEDEEETPIKKILTKDQQARALEQLKGMAQKK